MPGNVMFTDEVSELVLVYFRLLFYALILKYHLFCLHLLTLLVIKKTPSKQSVRHKLIPH